MSRALDTDEPYVIPRELHGSRGADVVERLLPDVKRSVIRRLLRDGRVLRNGVPLEAWRKLREGDLLMLDPSVELETLPRHRRVPERPAVVYEDAACVVVAKPSGLATVPERSDDASVHGYLEDWFEAQDLRIVHRLDKETSGVLILAKGAEAARAFDLAFRERRIEKRYIAIVRGRPGRDSFTCDLPIGRTIRGGRVRIGSGKGAREARTEFTVLARYRGFALIEARPVTGRMHQIRAHLMRLRLPLAVDPMYGGARALYLSEIKPGYRLRRGEEERPLIARVTLHAAALRFTSPASGTDTIVEAELPKDLRVVVQKLDRFATETVAQEDEDEQEPR